MVGFGEMLYMMMGLGRVTFVGMCAILLDLQMVMDNIVCTFFAILNR